MFLCRIVSIFADSGNLQVDQRYGLIAWSSPHFPANGPELSHLPPRQCFTVLLHEQCSGTVFVTGNSG